METQSFLSLCTDVAHFLFSTLHLLLTRVLPLIAMLVGSLLLHLFRFTISFLFSGWPVFSTSKPSSSKGRSDMAAQQHSSAALHRDSLQEEPIYSDDDGPDPLQAEEPIYSDEDVSHALQEESIYPDEDGASALHQEQCFEDCLDADHELFIEEQRLLLRQYEEMKLMRARTPANGEMRDGANEPQMRRASSRVDLQQPRHVSWQEFGDRPLPGAAADTLRQPGNRGTNLVCNSVEEEVGDYRIQEEGDVEKDAGGLELQGSLFPSDLPPSLDDVVNAAAAVTASRRTSTLSTAPRRRALPPSLSNVQKALHDMNNTRSEQSPDDMHAAGAAAAAAAPARSYDHFFAKFKHHFKLDAH